MTIDEMCYDRGYRDGLEGWGPSSTTAKYLEGYWVGRRERAEKKFHAEYHGFGWVD